MHWPSLLSLLLLVGAGRAKRSDLPVPARFSGVLVTAKVQELHMFGGGVAPDVSTATRNLSKPFSVIESSYVVVLSEEDLFQNAHQHAVVRTLDSKNNSEGRFSAKGQACGAIESGAFVLCYGGVVLHSYNDATSASTYVNSTLGVYDTLAGNFTTPMALSGSVIPRLEYAAMAVVGNTSLLFGGFSPDISSPDGLSNATYSITFNETIPTDPTTLNLPPPTTAVVEEINGTAPTARWQHCMTPVGPDSILLYGGNGSAALSDTWIFSTTQSTWTELTPNISPGARWNAACATTLNNTAFLFGGDDGTGGTKNDLWRFDANGTWVNVNTTGAPPTPRVYSSMTAVGSDWLVVSGMLVV
ncbi:hypothetical protein BDK51DRAFT_34643 [Blyttiomyces helicus]|uniref:Galactose oxidase n=1 Tax=Blyttiomyces helicus TaxID=388810 RepID=A0A4P9WPZ8_9FUNG|nr:hypothetical protein BDK51DRAFT_34643 [Blyttiomyces helicus]|eukprot:RKO94223.1 hypothetical protein BDK51DRAFT_34643 [Blyttiomyces helicus]